MSRLFKSDEHHLLAKTLHGLTATAHGTLRVAFAGAYLVLGSGIAGGVGAAVVGYGAGVLVTVVCGVLMFVLGNVKAGVEAKLASFDELVHLVSSDQDTAEESEQYLTGDYEWIKTDPYAVKAPQPVLDALCNVLSFVEGAVRGGGRVSRDQFLDRVHRDPAMATVPIEHASRLANLMYDKLEQKVGNLGSPSHTDGPARQEEAAQIVAGWGREVAAVRDGCEQRARRNAAHRAARILEQAEHLFGSDRVTQIRNLLSGEEGKHSALEYGVTQLLSAFLVSQVSTVAFGIPSFLLLTSGGLGIAGLLAHAGYGVPPNLQSFVSIGSWSGGILSALLGIGGLFAARAGTNLLQQKVANAVYAAGKHLHLSEAEQQGISAIKKQWYGTL